MALLLAVVLATGVSASVVQNSVAHSADTRLATILEDVVPAPGDGFVAPPAPENRDDLISRPGLGFAPGLSGADSGWLPWVSSAVAVASGLVVLGAAGAWAQRWVMDRDLRTRRLPARPARR